MVTGKPIFDSHILDCFRTFAVITSENNNSGSDGTVAAPPAEHAAEGDYSQDFSDERKYFATIIKANDIYLHCRLFSATSDAQVKQLFCMQNGNMCYINICSRESKRMLLFSEFKFHFGFAPIMALTIEI